jgi:hypothetical protein
MRRTRAETSGVRKRPTFEGIVEYIAYGQETIRYPDRLAKFMRNRPCPTQLDGEGTMDMQDQQEEAWEAQEKEHRIKILNTQRSAPEIRTKRDARSTRGSMESTGEGAQDKDTQHPKISTRDQNKT